MKRIHLLLMCLILVGAQTHCLAQIVTGYEYIIRNVTIVSPEKKDPVRKNRDIYISGDKIDKIKKARKDLVARGATIIDGTGKYLMAGLADMHAHIPADNQDKYLLMNLAAGVTTLRSMRGDTSHIALKRDIEEGKRIGPGLFISAPPISARTSFHENELPKTVAAYKHMGFDLIKVLSVPDSSYFEKLMAAAHASNIMVAGHSPGQVAVSRVIESGYSSVEHLQGLINIYQKDASLMAPVIKSLKIKNTYNCPTLDWYFITSRQYTLDELKTRQGLEYVDKQLVDKWIVQIENQITKDRKREQDSVFQEQEQRSKYIQAKLELVKMLHDQKAPLLLSPDASAIFAVPGFNMHQEMKLYSRAGLSNRDILKIAVYNAAEYMGKQKEWGSIDAGMKANLILLSENPLDSIDNIRHLEAVITHGEYLTAKEIKNKLNQ